jgi:cytochrome c553
VPVGALAHGRRIATNGPAGAATACAKCHGPQLLGVGVIPPIAGRSPSNLLRQLINFRVGTRHEEGSAPMQAVVNALTIDDMVAVAAYVGSRAPSAVTATKATAAHTR